MGKNFRAQAETALAKTINDARTSEALLQYAREWPGKGEARDVAFRLT
jgi:hypothetical protein